MRVNAVRQFVSRRMNGEPVKPSTSREPQRVMDGVWYYEEPGALHFVVECRQWEGVLSHVEFRVRASKLRRSLGRMPRKDGAK